MDLRTYRSLLLGCEQNPDDLARKQVLADSLQGDIGWGAGWCRWLLSAAMHQLQADGPLPVVAGTRQLSFRTVLVEGFFAPTGDHRGATLSVHSSQFNGLLVVSLTFYIRDKADE